MKLKHAINCYESSIIDRKIDRIHALCIRSQPNRPSCLEVPYVAAFFSSYTMSPSVCPYCTVVLHVPYRTTKSASYDRNILIRQIALNGMAFSRLIDELSLLCKSSFSFAYGISIERRPHSRKLFTQNSRMQSVTL